MNTMNTSKEKALLQVQLRVLRMKRRLSAYEAQKSQKNVGDVMDGLRDRLRDAFSRKFSTETLLPDLGNGAVESIIPIDKVPEDVKALLSKLVSGGIEGASVRISELNPDGSVKQQKIIGDPGDFGEDSGDGTPRH